MCATTSHEPHEPSLFAQVKFVGLKGSITCYPPQLSTDWPPPPLPPLQGFEARVGDSVFFCGADASVVDGEKMEHGARGEVATLDCS